MQIKSKVLLILLVTVVILSSCGKKFPGFTDSGDNYFYKFHEREECDAHPVVGDKVTFTMRVYGSDTVFSESHPITRQRVEPSVYIGDLYTAIQLMCEGDSATFILSVDSLNFYYGVEGLEGFPGEYLYVDIRLLEVYTIAMQNAERDRLIALERDILEEYEKEHMSGFTEVVPGVFFKETVRGRGPQITESTVNSLKLFGKTLEGEVFFPEEDDNLDFRITDDHGIPFNWNAVLQQLREGSKAEIVLTSPNAFGRSGYGGGMVKPYQSVKLTVEVRKVANSPKEFEEYSIQEFVRKHNISERPGPGGVYHITLEPGTGDLLRSGDNVEVHYVGYYIDNLEVFDSSRRYGQPFEVVIDQSDVIEGWHVGLKRMRVGERARLIIPSSLGYGERGYPPYIGPYAPLVFDLEVVSKI